MTSTIVAIVAVAISLFAVWTVRTKLAESALAMGNLKSIHALEMSDLRDNFARRLEFLNTRIEKLEEVLTYEKDEEHIPPMFQPIPVLQPNPAIAEQWAQERDKHRPGSPKYIAFTQRLEALGYGT